jgi:uncharacterized protein YndB with AHSA1/START domain
MDQATKVEPVRKTVTVDCSVEHAFRTFTERIGEWWPLEIHSVGAEILGVRPISVSFEGASGGRLVERMDDGQEAPWANVLAWEAPHRLVLAWNPNPRRTIPTEIEVTFTQDEAGRTRVDLEHRGWERLGPEGPELRDGYSDWERVLGRFADLANAG